MKIILIANILPFSMYREFGDLTPTGIVRSDHIGSGIVGVMLLGPQNEVETFFVGQQAPDCFSFTPRNRIHILIQEKFQTKSL